MQEPKLRPKCNQYTIYIKDENLNAWLKIKNRSKWIQDMLTAEGQMKKLLRLNKQYLRGETGVGKDTSAQNVAPTQNNNFSVPVKEGRCEHYQLKGDCAVPGCTNG